MSKLYIKPYGSFVLTGRDFPTTESQMMRRILFSPDNIHSVSVVSLRDGTLLFTNQSKIRFEMSLSRNGKVLAVLKLRPDLNEVIINTNWRLTENGVKNREIHGNPDLIISKNINIDLQMDGIGRIDLKVNDSGFASCVFSAKELLFVRMNGPSVFPHLFGLIEAEAQRNLPTLDTVLRHSTIII